MKTVSVLVIEYGPLDNREPPVLVPGLLNLTSSPYLFNLTSVPQRGLSNGVFKVPAAAVVGGGTVVNGMFFDRGSAADYDAWTELGGLGWGWKDLLPYFKKAGPTQVLIFFASGSGFLTQGRARILLRLTEDLRRRLISPGMIPFMDMVDLFNRAILYSSFRPSVCVLENTFSTSLPGVTLSYSLTYLFNNI